MSANDYKKFREILSKQGYRVTTARETTFKLLMSPDPQSIGDLLQKADKTVDRVSVYRSIELFEKLGIVHRIYIGWKYKLELSDEFMEHHHHLSCLKCGQIIDIDDEKHIEDFITEVSREFGFQPRRHQFEIDGYCQNCAIKLEPVH